jgi:hypothetical protein
MAAKYLSKYRPGFMEEAEAKANRDGAGLESSGTAIAT